MTIPAVMFGVLVATLLGALFHLWRGGSILRLLFFIVLSWAGFWIGHFLGRSLNFDILVLGSLQIGAGIIGSLVLLALGYWLSLVQRYEQPH